MDCPPAGTTSVVRAVCFGARVGPMPNVCSVEEAVGLLRPVDQVGFGLGPAIPDAFLTALGCP